MKEELKTLKDMTPDDPYSVLEEIKTEAVKKIKRLLELMESNSIYSLPIEFGDFLIKPSENYRELWSIINYIKWDNNLTVEDLK